MTFDMQAAREICIKLGMRYPARTLVNDDYQCALAAEMLPAALDHIAELEAALIEERAKCLHFCHVGDGEYCPDTLEEADHFKKRHMPEAEDELRAEGKL